MNSFKQVKSDFPVWFEVWISKDNDHIVLRV